MNSFKSQQAPDFEADAQFPEWHQFAQQGESPNISPLVDALKKRMMKPPDMGGIGGALGGEIKPAGGMKSL